MPRTLYVGGVSFSTSNDRLRALFSEVGDVESVTLTIDQATGQSRGFGTVEMVSAAGADAVIKKFDRQEIDGRQIRVHRAHAAARTGGVACK